MGAGIQRAWICRDRGPLRADTLTAAEGTILIARKVLAPKAEQVFFAMFLIMIAAFHWLFTSEWQRRGDWRCSGAWSLLGVRTVPTYHDPLLTFARPHTLASDAPVNVRVEGYATVTMAT